MSCNITAPAAAACPDSPGDGCYISEGAGMGLTFGLLVLFTLTGAIAVPYIKWKSASAASDFWYTARDSQSWWSVALSICATSAGAWLLYTPGEAAFLGGWWGILGYPVAMFLGPLVMCMLAEKVREQLPDGGNITDWVLKRYGRGVQLYVTFVLIYYMFIYLVSQLKTMGDMTVKFYGKDAEWGIVPVALFTMLYTMIGGLPASIMTDWLQAVAIMAFVVIICVTLFTDVHFPYSDFKEVSKGKDAGWDAFVALCISIFGAEVFNLAFWQRIYAAKDTRNLRIGFLVGAGMVSFITFIFGLSSLLLKANDMRQNRECPPEGTPIYVPAFTFFEVLDMPDTTGFTRALVFLLAVCTITSCADSFQTAITSVVSKEVERWKLGDIKGLVLTITLVVPLFGGLWGFVTTNGCLAGMLSGLFYIILWGWVEFGTFVAGFTNLTLQCFGNEGVQPQGYSPYACGPWYARRSAMLFTTIPLVTFVVTYTVSWMENVYVKVSKVCEQIAPQEPKEPREPQELADAAEAKESLTL